MIEYVTQKYGRENVAQIITFGTMKARAVVRDVARVMDIPYADADRVAKAVPPALDMTLEKALAESPALKEMEQKDERVKELLAVARRLEGMTRHASVHAAGVVIAPRPLTEFVPLYKSQKDEIVTQWAMKEVERVGLLKMDFLGLSTLTLIRDALEEIKRTEGIDVDIDDVPLDDEKTYKLFADGQTYGVFQFESSGMRELLRKARPERLDDLIALNALYRPGPLKSGMVDDFIARKQGKTEVKYELPALAPILSDTYGVIAYQEQVMRIAAVLAGFSMGQSDVLRKAMGKKDPKVMAKQREAFMQGALAKGVNEKKAKKIFDLMEFFAGYGFNKSHSTTYALLAYQTAYLKANFPRHFMAALLTIEAANTDKLAMYLGECRDLRHSDPAARHQLEPAGVHGRAGRRPLRTMRSEERRRGRDRVHARQSDRNGPDRLAVHPLRTGRSAPRQQAAAREPGQGRRVRLAAPTVPLPHRRARLFAAVDKAIEHGGRQQRNRQDGRVSFFDLPQDGEEPGAIPLPEVAPWTEAQQLAFEKEALGLYMSGHPLERFSGDLKAFGAQRIADLTGSHGRRLGRRHRQRPAPVEDQEGRPHGGVRPRRHRRRHRGRGVPGDLRQACRIHRGGRDGARPRKVREGRGIRAPGRDRAPRRSPRSASGRRAKSRSICRCRRTADRPSKHSPSCSRGIAAIAKCRSSSTSAASPGRCGFMPMWRSAFDLPSDWSKKSSRSAARDR